MKRTILALALVATTFGAFAQTPAAQKPATQTAAEAHKPVAHKTRSHKKAAVKKTTTVVAPKPAENKK